MRDRLFPFSLLIAACVVAGGVACSDSSTDPLVAKERPSTPGQGGNTGGTDSSGTDTSTTSPAVGPVASVTLSPETITVSVGNYVAMVATARNASGQVLSGKTFAWRSSDASIVAVGDTGVLRAVAAGVVTVHASVDGKEGSARVTVVPAEEPPPVVDSFTVHGIVRGVPGGGDSTTTPPVLVAGAAVTVYRVGTAGGDTLGVRERFATTTTDAGGRFTLTDVPSAYYTVEVVPPAGSPFDRGSSGFGPQRSREITLPIVLRAKP